MSLIHSVSGTNGGAHCMWPACLVGAGPWTLQEVFSNCEPDPLWTLRS